MRMSFRALSMFKHQEQKLRDNMKTLLLTLAVATLTACAGLGVGVGSYEDEDVKAYYIGIGVKANSVLPDVPSLPNRPEKDAEQ